MIGRQIEAIFENGVFRPLQPVQLPEHQRVTVLLQASEVPFVPTNARNEAVEDEMDQEVAYFPLPLQHCGTIRVRVRRVGDLAPLPYAVQEEQIEVLDQAEHP